MGPQTILHAPLQPQHHLPVGSRSSRQPSGLHSLGLREWPNRRTPETTFLIFPLRPHPPRPSSFLPLHQPLTSTHPVLEVPPKPPGQPRAEGRGWALELDRTGLEPSSSLLGWMA